MTKKQFGIIFTLMALIVCVGVLAAKLNKTGLNDPTDFSQVISQGTNENKDDEKKKDDKETLGAQDYFYSIRSDREKNTSVTIESLNTIINDTKTSQEQKDLASNELREKTMLADKESTIEVNVKSKGFEDALCSIDGNKVRIFVRSDEISEADASMLQEIAENVSGISDVIIEVKK